VSILQPRGGVAFKQTPLVNSGGLPQPPSHTPKHKTTLEDVLQKGGVRVVRMKFLQRLRRRKQPKRMRLRRRQQPKRMLT
jgi:hypothetical protein